MANSRLKISNDKLVKDYDSLKKKLTKSKQKASKIEDHNKVLQKKLDDLWERSQLEKENVKLTAKYEAEQDSRKKIEELNRKISELEKELNEQVAKEREYIKKEKQLEKIKRELVEQSMRKSQELNKSVHLNQEFSMTHGTNVSMLAETNYHLSQENHHLEKDLKDLNK